MCKGNPYQWPKYLGECQRVLNSMVHTTTGEQPHYVFFSRRPYRQILTQLPSLEDEVDDSDIATAHEIIQKTHKEMSQTFVNVANRKRKNQAVEVNALVWAKCETQIPGTSRKLNVKWLGPYRVLESIRNGAVYRLENCLDQTVIERAANKVKPYFGSETWISQLQEHSENVPDVVLEGIRTRGARNIVPPSRLIEEI